MRSNCSPRCLRDEGALNDVSRNHLLRSLEVAMNLNRSSVRWILISPFLIAIILAILTNTFAQVWNVVTFDGKGDGKNPSLPDAATLSYRYDKEQDTLWFRVGLYSSPPKDAFGVNIVIDTGAENATKMNWWGSNKDFKYDKLVTAWVTYGKQGYEGTIGVADASGVTAKHFNNIHQNDLQVRVEGNAIILGVKRTDVTDNLKMKLIAAVGSNDKWNDDVPGVGPVAIDLTAAKPTRLREIDTNRNNFEFPPNYKTLPDDRSPKIEKRGRGRQTLILVPGMYSGASSFDDFINRNQNRYSMYILTPPGINGTPARALPPLISGFEQMTWTRQLERDLVNLIRSKKLAKPVIVAERHPASIAAFELATEHPELVGGVILTGTILVSNVASISNPTKPPTPQERAVSVDELWALQWFKYVTPETWLTNDIPSVYYANDSEASQKAWRESEDAPLQVKIRYTCEFWASDVRQNFEKLQVPVVALVPQFDEQFLADPTYGGYAKNSVIGSWQTLVPKHPLIELVKIPESRMNVLVDQPRAADDAIAAFVDRVSPTR